MLTCAWPTGCCLSQPSDLLKRMEMLSSHPTWRQLSTTAEHKMCRRWTFASIISCHVLCYASDFLQGVLLELGQKTFWFCWLRISAQLLQLLTWMTLICVRTALSFLEVPPAWLWLLLCKRLQFRPFATLSCLSPPAARSWSFGEAQFTKQSLCCSCSSALSPVRSLAC